MQDAKQEAVVNPPPPQALKRCEHTAAEAAMPTPLLQPVHELASAERPEVQEPALGHPVIFWQPLFAVVPLWQPVPAVAAPPQKGD